MKINLLLALFLSVALALMGQHYEVGNLIEVK
jgi:hypothetical protein